MLKKMKTDVRRRSSLYARGEPAADFMLQGPAEHGIPGLVNLFGIESPGLTSSLAIADEVLRRLSVLKENSL